MTEQETTNAAPQPGGEVSPPADEPLRHPGDLPEDDNAPEAELDAEGDGEDEGEDGGEESPEEIAAREAAAVAVEEDDFEFEGHKLRVPKAVAEALKKGTMLNADYTKKTMELGEKERAVAEREKEHEAYVKAATEDVNARAAYVAKYQELEQYAKVDWQTWNQQDPVACQAAFMRSQQLRGELQGLGTQIQQRNQQRSQEAQQATAKRLGETLDYAKREIPGWSPDLDSKLGEFAKTELGVTNEMLREHLTPGIYKALYFARIGHEAVTKATTAKPPQKQVQPLRVVGAKANPPAATDPSKMSTEQYVKWRKNGGGGGKALAR